MRSKFPALTAALLAGVIGLPLFAFGQAATAPAGIITRAVESVTGPPSTARLRELHERASAIIGAGVYNDQGMAIGKVDDVLLTAVSSGPTAVVSVGGFLGVGERLVTMPLSDLRFGGPQGHWTLAGATRDSLTARPAFHYDRQK